ncbi:tailspike protein [Bacillus phage vB_BceM-HSE3]|nr:tailspike protein [Bacillus phage vB_BceM-HSE3]
MPRSITETELHPSLLAKINSGGTGGGGGSVEVLTEYFSSTSNQSIFKLTKGAYEVNKGLIQVFIEGVRQESGIHYTEANSTTIILSAGLSAGTLVTISWFSNNSLPSNTTIHAGRHQKGGADELNIKDLAGYQELLDRIGTGGGSGGSLYIKSEEFISTANQTSFRLTEGTYVTNSKLIQVYIQGILQVSGSQYYETDQSTITFSSPLPAGTPVFITWIVPNVLNFNITTEALSESFVSSANQSVFNLTKGSYTINKNLIKVYVQGLLQTSGTHYTEVSPTQIKFSEGLPEGTPVFVWWIANGSYPPGSNLHAERHKKGGIDELRIEDLSGYDTLVADLSQREINVKNYGAVGDGVHDDAPAIQQALRIAKTSGAVTVIIPEGTYLVRSRLIIYKNTTIKMTRNTILKRGSNSFFVNGETGDSYTGYNGNGNITITGGTLDGNTSVYPSSYSACAFNHGTNITIRDVTFKNGLDSHCFELCALDGVLIENCQFLGYQVKDVTRNYVEAIQIDSCTQPAFPAFGAWDGTPTKNITIRKCKFSKGDTPENVGWATAIGAHGCVHDIWNENIRVEDCVFEGMTYAGVRAFKWKDTIITNNKFINCSAPIISEIPAPNSGNTKDKDGNQSGVTQPSYRTTISGNTIINVISGAGINVKGYNDPNVTVYSESVLITGNRIIGTPSDQNAINISHCINVTISHNYSESSRRLVFIYNCISSDIHDNQDKLNGVNTVLADTCTNCKIHDNISISAGGSGISTTGTTNFDVYNNYVENASSSADASANGLHFTGNSKKGRVYNNKVVIDATKNSVAYGLRIISGCTEITTFNNDLQGKNGRYDNQQTTKGDSFLMYSPNGSLCNVTITDALQFQVTKIQ